MQKSLFPPHTYQWPSHPFEKDIETTEKEIDKEHSVLLNPKEKFNEDEFYHYFELWNKRDSLIYQKLNYVLIESFNKINAIFSNCLMKDYKTFAGEVDLNSKQWNQLLNFQSANPKRTRELCKEKIEPLKMLVTELAEYLKAEKVKFFPLTKKDVLKDLEQNLKDWESHLTSNREFDSEFFSIFEKIVENKKKWESLLYITEEAYWKDPQVSSKIEDPIEWRSFFTLAKHLKEIAEELKKIEDQQHLYKLCEEQIEPMKQLVGQLKDCLQDYNLNNSDAKETYLNNFEENFNAWTSYVISTDKCHPEFFYAFSEMIEYLKKWEYTLGITQEDYWKNPNEYSTEHKTVFTLAKHLQKIAKEQTTQATIRLFKKLHIQFKHLGGDRIPAPPSTELIATKDFYIPKFIDSINRDTDLNFTNYNHETIQGWKRTIRCTNDMIDSELGKIYLLEKELEFYKHLLDNLDQFLSDKKVDLAKLINYIVSRFKSDKYTHLNKIHNLQAKFPSILIPALKKGVKVSHGILNFLLQVFESNETLKNKIPLNTLAACYLMAVKVFFQADEYNRQLLACKKELQIHRSVIETKFKKVKEVRWDHLEGCLEWKNREDETNPILNNLYFILGMEEPKEKILNKNSLFDSTIELKRKPLIDKVFKAAFEKIREDKSEDFTITPSLVTALSNLALHSGLLGIPYYDQKILNYETPILHLMELILAIDRVVLGVDWKESMDSCKPSTILKVHMLGCSHFLMNLLRNYLKEENSLLEKNFQNPKYKFNSNQLKTEKTICQFLRKILDVRLLVLGVSGTNQTILNQITDLYLEKIKLMDRFTEKCFKVDLYSLKHWQDFRWGQQLPTSPSSLLNIGKEFMGIDFTPQLNSLLAQWEALKVSDEKTKRKKDFLELVALKLILNRIIQVLGGLNNADLKYGDEESLSGKLGKAEIKCLNLAYKKLLFRYSQLYRQLSSSNDDGWWSVVSQYLLGKFSETFDIPVIGSHVLMQPESVEEITAKYELAALGDSDVIEDIKELIPSFNQNVFQITADLKKLAEEFMQFAEDHPARVQAFARYMLIAFNTFSSDSFFKKFKNVIFAQMYAAAAMNHLGNSYKKPINRLDHKKWMTLMNLGRHLPILAGGCKVLFDFLSKGLNHSTASLLNIPLESFKTMSEAILMRELTDFAAPDAKLIATLLSLIEGKYSEAVEMNYHASILELGAQMRHAFLKPEEFKKAWKNEISIWINSLFHPQKFTERAFRIVVQVGGPLLILAGVKGIFAAVLLGSLGIWLAIPLAVGFVGFSATLVIRAYSFINSVTKTRQKVENKMLDDEPSIKIQCAQKVKEVTEKFFQDLKKYNALLDLPVQMEKLEENFETAIAEFTKRNLDSVKYNLDFKAKEEKLESPKDYIHCFRKHLSPDAVKKHLYIPLAIFLKQPAFSQLSQEAKQQIAHQVVLRFIQHFEQNWLRPKIEELFLEEILFDLKHNGKNETIEKKLAEFKSDSENKKLAEDLNYASEYFEKQLGKSSNDDAEEKQKIKQALKGIENVGKLMKASVIPVK